MSSDANPERIVRAAIRLEPSNAVCSVARPGRHHNVIWDYCDRTGARRFPGEHTQGFLTNTGRFVDRKEALQLAIAAGQTDRGRFDRHLYSEDLW